MSKQIGPAWSWELCSYKHRTTISRLWRNPLKPKGDHASLNSKYMASAYDQLHVSHNPQQALNNPITPTPEKHQLDSGHSTNGVNTSLEQSSPGLLTPKDSKDSLKMIPTNYTLPPTCSNAGEQHYSCTTLSLNIDRLECLLIVTHYPATIP